jgi:hypothetical protein
MGKDYGVPAQANRNQMVLADQAMDQAIILKNVRDLAKTASFLDMDDITELHQLAYKNLKEKMTTSEDGVPGVLMADPLLSMEVYKLLTSVRMQVVETKRKSVDTLLKARVLLDLSVPVQPDEGSEDKDPFDEEVTDGVVIQETGVFGGVLEAGYGSNEEVSYGGDPGLPGSQQDEGDEVGGEVSGPYSGLKNEVDVGDIPF